MSAAVSHSSTHAITANIIYSPVAGRLRPYDAFVALWVMMCGFFGVGMPMCSTQAEFLFNGERL